MLKRIQPKRLVIGGIIGLLIGLLIVIGTRLDGFFLTNLLDEYEYRSYDARMKSHAGETEEASIDSIVIIDIEQNSVQDLGNYKDWPQAYHGQLIDVVTSGEPKALLFDIIFDPEDRFQYDLVQALRGVSPLSDTNLSMITDQYLFSNDPKRFIESTQSSGIVYHALVFESSDSSNFLYKMDQAPEGYDYKNHLIKIPEDQAVRLPTAERLGNTFVDLLSSAKRTGSANFPQDMDGITRRAPTAIYFEGPGQVYPSLPFAAAMELLGVPDTGLNYDFDELILTLTDSTGRVVREIPIDEQGRMYVNYFGYFKTYYYLPYRYCFDPEMLPPEYWKDRIAIVGSSLPGLMDLRNTPVQETFAGVEIHANVLYSLLQNKFVKVIPENTANLTILALCVLIGLVTSLLRKPVFTIPVVMMLIILWVIFVYSRFLTSLESWEVVRPITGMGFAYISVFLYNFLISEKDKRFLKTTFSTYISPTLIDQMYENKQLPSLGGDEGYHTAFFTDIQSFSAFSELLSASDLVELLNEYLTELTDVLLENKGTLDKYIGDAIVAFYGAPAPVENHEYYACMTALQMQERLGELRGKWKAQGDRWPAIVHEMQNRIGINSGKMVTGNMGSATRMNYTMMGDTVNLAARLEASAKQYGIYIQVAEPTYLKVKDQFIWRDLDYVQVMGKAQPVRVYELISTKEQKPLDIDNLLSVYHQALIFYREQQWSKAIEQFKKSDQLEDMFPGRKTNPSRVYISRCEYWKNNPPPEDWNGAWQLTSK